MMNFTVHSSFTKELLVYLRIKFWAVSKHLKVFKFGGASVKDAASIKNVLDIVKRYDKDQLVIVVSAMAKTTNHLEQVVSTYAEGGDAFAVLEEVKNFHYGIARELFESPEELLVNLNDTLVEIEWLLEEPMEDSSLFNDTEQ